MTRLGLGIVGVGRMGAAHARIIAARVPEVRLVALGDVDREAARRLAPDVGDPRTYDTVDALVTDPEVEAVLIAVSSSRHLDVARTVAAAGRHILCEKPLALSIPDTDALIEVARDHGVQLQVGFMRRHDPDHRRARDRLRSGELGRPYQFTSAQLDPDPPPLAFADPRVSGGIMVDMGIHEFDLARWLMDDEVAEVAAWGSTLAHPELATVGDVDSAVVNLRFASGATGSVRLARSTRHGEDVRTEVLATDGAVWLGDLPRASSATARTGLIAWDSADPGVPRFERAYAEQARAFARAILDGHEVTPDGADGRAAMRIALAADRSTREGRPVLVAEIAGAPGDRHVTGRQRGAG